MKMTDFDHQSRLSARRHHGLILILAVLVFAASLFRADDDASRDPVGHRLLRPSPHGGGNATAHPPGTGETVTVYVTDAMGDNPAHSIFYTDVLRRYGSGNVDYRVVEKVGYDRQCYKWPTETSGPCLAVTKEGAQANHDFLKCNFPGCKTMVSNDERCEARGGFDARQYYSADLPLAGYLPLGPRHDAWKSFRKIMGKDDFVAKPSSGRRYAFNAVFTKGTNHDRTRLAKIIESKGEGTLPTFTSMARSWTPDVNDPLSEQVDTDRYASVLLDSAFTLAPAGRSPECFRLFEAAEAGSIPVLVRTDMAQGIPCMDPLRHWRDAPVLVLKYWEDLYPTIKKMLDDPKALDRMQAKLRLWYESYMRESVADLEDFVLESEDEVERRLHLQKLSNELHYRVVDLT